MFLDTTRLISKHADNLVDEIWTYIDKGEVVQASILLLAAQKQIRKHLVKKTMNEIDIAQFSLGEPLDATHREILAMIKEGKKGKVLKKLKDKKEDLFTARLPVVMTDKNGEAVEALIAREVSLNGFDIVKSRIDEALHILHRQELDVVKAGKKKGKALKDLKDKKEVLLTAHAVVGIVDKAGEYLGGYIQSHSEVTHEEIFEHVSSILSSNGIICFGKGIDPNNLESYQYWGHKVRFTERGQAN